MYKMNKGNKTKQHGKKSNYMTMIARKRKERAGGVGTGTAVFHRMTDFDFDLDLDLRSEVVDATVDPGSLSDRSQASPGLLPPASEGTPS